MTEKHTITIYDIAREAKVSTATVSRVITHSASVSAEKRERVEMLIRKYNFRPNALAKGLSKTHSRLIGMLCPDVRNPYYAGLFMACEREAYELGYTLILSNTFTREELEIAFLEKMTEQRVEAILICGGLIDRVVLPARYSEALRRTAQRVPVIVAGQTTMPGCSQICLDHADGMRQALRHLAGQGHRRIAFIYAGTDVFLTLIKRQAFLDGMRELGLPAREEYLPAVGHFNEVCGAEAMEKLLALPKPPTAVIGINDLVAAGALRCALDKGLRVPQDCALVGFDDSYVSNLSVPRLTSICYDDEEYGKRLVRLALEKIDGSGETLRAMQPVHLAVKASSDYISANVQTGD